jgi:hypothetical protein
MTTDEPDQVRSSADGGTPNGTWGPRRRHPRWFGGAVLPDEIGYHLREGIRFLDVAEVAAAVKDNEA